MSRFLVIGIFTVLILGIVGGGAVLVWQRLSGSETDSDAVVNTKEEGSGSLFGALPETEQSENQEFEEALSDNGDDDNDGLSNSDELIWGTDSKNPDTDGDGYLDGEEVAANHDPNKPAPDDLLEVATEPAAETQSAPSQEGLSLEGTEGYFADDLDLSGGTKDLKEEYEKQYPEEDRSPATMREFAIEQPVVLQLPRPEQSLIPNTKDNTPALIAQYLGVANNSNALANSSSYTQAENDLYSQNNSASMLGIANTIGVYRNQLQEVPVPEVALPTHIMLLGYTELLIATFEQIALWNDEPVKSMVGTRQLEIIDRKYYPIIQNELQRLEALQ